MANHSDLEEGQKVVFRHKIGDAGNLAKTEKVGRIAHVDSPERDYPVKVVLGVEETPGDERVTTYLEPEEINNIIKS